jgi:hypothetical protein
VGSDIFPVSLDFNRNKILDSKQDNIKTLARLTDQPILMQALEMEKTLTPSTKCMIRN